MIVYIDTSAAGKRLLDEPESAALGRYLDNLDDADVIASSRLLETELRRVAVRHELPQSHPTTILDGVTLVDMEPSLFHEAGVLSGHDLRSLDALHLTTALRIGTDVVLAYDRRLLTAAQQLGLETVSPN